MAIGVAAIEPPSAPTAAIAAKRSPVDSGGSLATVVRFDLMRESDVGFNLAVGLALAAIAGAVVACRWLLGY